MTRTDILIAIAALVGIGIGWQRVRGGPRAQATAEGRLVALAYMVLVAWSWSTRWRGFAYVLLMPIGAYKIGDIAGYWLAWWWPWPRRRGAADGDQLQR